MINKKNISMLSYSKILLQHRPRAEKILFVAAMIGYIVMFFPGLMSGDSESMYNYAVTNTYCSHTSYFIVWVWNKLNKVYPGPALMFLTNMALLWSAIYIFAFKIFKEPLARYALIIAPYTMWIRIYAGWIWKDTFLAFGYALLCALLCWKQHQKARFLWWESIGFWLLLMYCTELRWVQTRFICPLIILWFVQVQWPHWQRLKQWIVTVCFSAGLIFGIYAFHQNMIDHAANKNTYFWQYVNIYDLAGMSVYSNKNLVPDFLVVRPGLDNLKKKYDLLWEPLIVHPDSPLRATQSNQERIGLTQAWVHAVIRHPIAYIQHRSFVLFRGILDVNFSLNHKGKLSFLYHNSILFNCVKFLRGTVFSFGWILIALTWMTFLSSVSNIRKISQIGFTFLLVHFVYSLAGTPRYVYLSTVLCMFALIYALDHYFLFKKRSQNLGATQRH